MPLEQLSKDVHRIRELCDLLEALADDLPRRSEPIWREAGRLSSSLLPRHFEAVTQSLLPSLERYTDENGFQRRALAMVKQDFANCSACFPELAELLEHAPRGAARSNLPLEAQGYALRCFFEDIRRQIEWEERVLLPLAFERCDSKDLSDLTRCLTHGAASAGRDLYLVSVREGL